MAWYGMAERVARFCCRPTMQFFETAEDAYEFVLSYHIFWVCAKQAFSLAWCFATYVTHRGVCVCVCVRIYVSAYAAGFWVLIPA